MKYEKIKKGWVLAVACAIAWMITLPVCATLVTDGLVVRLAGDVTLDQDGRVTSWTDLTGNGHHAVPLVGQGSPLYVTDATPGGTGAVRFDSVAGNQALQIAGDSVFDGVPITLFVVYNRTSAGAINNARLINFAYDDSGDGTVAYNALNLVNRQNARLRGVARTDENTLIDTDVLAHGDGVGSYHVGGLTWDGSDVMTVMMTDSEKVSASTSVAGVNMAPVDHLFIRIGAGAAGTDDDGVHFQHEGEIAEVLIYTRLLSGQEIEDVQNYLYNTHLIPEPATLGLLVVSFFLIAVGRRLKK